MTDPTPAIDIVDLHKSFPAGDGTVRAVDGVDLTVRPGEVVAFLGPNGAGKTTTIDLMLDLARPDSGTVRLLGLPPGEAVARGLVSAVMQTGGLLRDLTARETVELVASFQRHHRPVRACLERAGVDEFADRRVGVLSGGQRQRLRFALALVPDPEIIVLDEPTTGMDVASRRAFWDAMRRDSDAGRTVLFATHHLEEADDYADRVVLLAEGRVVADGTGPEIRALASGREVQATVPGADDSLVARLGALPGAGEAGRQGDRITVHATDSDAVARELLALPGARDLEITSRSLEDAFLALTTGAAR